MLDQEITRRMDAYRGNPQALAQRYQQNQQLVDLLALQKLKSEKEAAARSLQMQQPDAGGLPTVAQQREQEVMDMTRQEVAQQVGQTAQQQQAKQQAAMQQLMSGLARAPGAANAMSPQAMAAGGIVAFQSGDLVDSTRGRSAQLSPGTRRRMEQTREEERRRQAIERIIEEERLQEQRRLAPEAVEGLGSTPTAPAEASLFAAEELPPTAQPAADRAAEAIPYAGPDERYAPNLAAPRAERAAAPEAAPAKAEASGVRALLDNQPSQNATSIPRVTPSSAMNAVGRAGDLARQMTGVRESDLRATQNQEEGLAALRGLIQSQHLRASDYPGMTPEDLAARRAEIASARQRMEQDFDPSRQRLDQLIAFLSGAAGRTSLGSVGAGGARAAQATAAQQEAARRERLKEVSGMEEGLRSKLETERMGKFQAMQAAGDRAVNARLKLTELSNALAEGDARRANELLNTGLRLAGEAGMTDARLKTEVDMLFQKLGVQVDENARDRFIKAIDIASRERTAAAQIDKTTDAREMIAAYEADFIEQGMSPVKARAAAAERFQSNYRDATNRAAATEARKIGDVMKSPLVTVLLPGLMSKDPAKKEAAQKQLREVFALAGIDPDSAAAAAAMSQQTPGAPTRPSAGGSTPPLPPGFKVQ
jgi:hypothetical protein